ncbi:hypothetical protein ACLIBH_12305 [Virgibacillus sp. W0430]|uniref:hypothetical protein n=1 Tax=Virgibacillus sp. W0430 TaxID=3391580 RepID=UPI003F483EDF
MEFHIKIQFLHKESITKKVEEKDGFTAISNTLNSLDSTGKDNIKSVGIIYMN